MKKINDKKLLAKYISKYKISECFSDFKMIKTELVQYEKGEFIYMEGNKIKDLLFFVDGRIEIYNLSRNGNGFTIAYCEPLGFLGDMEYLAEIPTPNNVEALTTVTCIAIPLKANKHILENDIKFYKFLSKTLVNKTLGLSQSICNEKVPSIEKLKSYLELIGKNHIIDTNLNEIAQSIGISYRQLMRHMNRLCEAGYLSKGEKKGVYIMK
ncbi:MAG TPA: hypothetical protein DG753_12740 [Clostridium sp.]|nr:hypothetical protein [Clostridium sp.]